MMIRKKILLLITVQFILFISTLSAALARERILIQNELDESITILCEFRLKESSPIGESFPMYWDQLLAGRGMACYSLFETKQEQTFKAGANIFLVEYLPKFYPQDQTDYPGLVNWEIARESWSILDKIPLEQKLKELFKTLVISDAKGKVLLTLDDFSKARVEVRPNGRTYDIIIGEYLYQ